MSRLIYVPQYPSKLRYQEWWYNDFWYEFERQFDCKKLSLNLTFNATSNKEMFSPIEDAIDAELNQINQYMALELQDDDILFMSDISFPGIFPTILYHVKPKKCFAFCHGTSINRYDYFEDLRYSKWDVETGFSKLFNTVFVATNYHAKKLGWRNTKVVGLPIPDFPYKCTVPVDKKYDIISVARPCKQKVSEDVEQFVSSKFGPIVRKECKSWEEYYTFLNESKILLISGKEDTFNYSIMEATFCNCIPLAPDRCSYPELLPEEYIYTDNSDLEEKIKKYLKYYDEVPELINIDLCKNFFNNVIDEMIK